MRCVVQRVKEASVTVDGEIVGKTGPGILALIGVSTEDTDKDYKYILDKVPNLRIFDDENGVMNRSLLDEGHSILAVSLVSTNHSEYLIALALYCIKNSPSNRMIEKHGNLYTSNDIK